MELPIKVEIDADILLALSKWHEQSFFDKEGVMHKLFEQGEMSPFYLEKELKNNSYSYPVILKDKWLSLMKKDRKGHLHYDNLNNIAFLYKCATEGIVQLCVNNAVLKHFASYKISPDFLNEYVIPIRYTEEMKKDYRHSKERLLERYIKYKVLGENVENNLYNASCNKLAHASLQGLDFIVKRDDIFIHRRPMYKDFEYADNIIDANLDVNLTFNTTLGKKYAPHPQTLNTFVIQLKYYLMGEFSRLYAFTESNIDENYIFTPNVMPNFD